MVDDDDVNDDEDDEEQQDLQKVGVNSHFCSFLQNQSLHLIFCFLHIFVFVGCSFDKLSSSVNCALEKY